MFVRMHRSQNGVSLAEVLVALFILSAVGVAAVVGLGTTVKVNDMARTRITAESLARSELEYVVSENYTKLYPNPGTEWSYTLSESGDSYPSWDSLHNGLPWDYPGYTITVSSVEKSPDIQMITVTVKYIYSQNPDNIVLTIVTYRVLPPDKWE